MSASRPQTQESSFDAVRGERGPAQLGNTTTLQTRASHALAIGLMLTVGLGMLGWYYSRAFATQKAPRTSTANGLASKWLNDVPLAPLGRIAMPAPSEQSGATTSLILPSKPDSPPDWLSRPAASEVSSTVPLAPSASAPSPPPTPAQRNAERRLSGAVFAAESSSQAPMLPIAATADSGQSGPTGPIGPTAPASAPAPTPAAIVAAHRLPTQQLLLPKGAFIDCTLETAIDSTLPGMTTCITATDTFSADGTVVLLERGTKLTGEIRGQVQQGAARVFVLWDDARTPDGVVVPLGSPGADALGRNGLPGAVNRHFWQRFGAAILVSTIDGAVQAAVGAQSHGNGTVVYSPGASQEILTEVLKSTVGIAPTIVKRQGDRIQVLVARDLDFRAVYELRAVSGGG